MDAIENLLTRASVAKLRAPAPAGAAREAIFAAALRAPDHARLRPWRFLVVEGEGREQLGEALARAELRRNPAADEAVLVKLRANPLRAPLLLVLLARVVEHPKVPPVEQYLSVGCAAHAMLLAAHALGFGGIWRSGTIAWSEALREELALDVGEQPLGFLYLGTPEAPARPAEAPPSSAHFRPWPAR